MMKKCIKLLDCAFVRNHLKYAWQIWDPCYETYRSRLKTIQERILLDYKTGLFLSRVGIIGTIYCS